MDWHRQYGCPVTCICAFWVLLLGGCGNTKVQQSVVKPHSDSRSLREAIEGDQDHTGTLSPEAGLLPADSAEIRAADQRDDGVPTTVPSICECGNEGEPSCNDFGCMKSPVAYYCADVLNFEPECHWLVFKSPSPDVIVYCAPGALLAQLCQDDNDCHVVLGSPASDCATAEEWNDEIWTEGKCLAGQCRFECWADTTSHPECAVDFACVDEYCLPADR